MSGKSQGDGGRSLSTKVRSGLAPAKAQTGAGQRQSKRTFSRKMRCGESPSTSRQGGGMTTPEPASDESRRKTCAAADFRPARPQPRISGGEPIPDSSERAGDRAAADSDHR